MIKRMVWHFTGPGLDPHWLILFEKIFPNSLEIDQTKHYTPTVINLFGLVTVTSVVVPEEYFLEYSSD